MEEKRMAGMIIVLSGPSGAGKGKICDELSKRRNDIRKIASVTTRTPREGELEKNSYIFVSEEKFLAMKEMEMFFETNYYDGAWYGTLKVPTEELFVRDLIFDKDVNGALAIKKEFPDAITIYVMPKNNDTLVTRRGDRGEHRAEIAIEEVPKAKMLDFLVINDDIEETVNQVEKIIECMRVYSGIRKFSMSETENKEFIDNFYK